MSGLAATMPSVNESSKGDQIRSRSINQVTSVAERSAVKDDVNLNVDAFSSSSKSMTHSDTTGTGSRIKYAINVLPTLLADNRCRTPVICAMFNSFLILFLQYLCDSTHSLAFRSLVFLAIFDLSSLMTCLVSIWVSRQPLDPVFSFGFSRCEVLSVFASTMLAMLGCFIVFKESVEHFIVPHSEELDPNLIMLGTSAAMVFHMFVTYGVKNPAMRHAIDTAPSSWLQEHVADVSRAVCAIVPGLDKILLPRINSVALFGISCAAMLAASTFLVTVTSYLILDNIAASLISFFMFVTMLPLGVYSAKILVQTTPSHVVGQLRKTLSEVSTLDGVLEFRNEHFWTIGFNNLCGSVQVRVRRDANEQMVLAHVLSRLSSTAANVTVQIFKDDWTQISAATKFYYNKSCTVDKIGENGEHGHSHSHGHGHSHSHDKASSHSHSHDTGSSLASPQTSCKDSHSHSAGASSQIHEHDSPSKAHHHSNDKNPSLETQTEHCSIPRQFTNHQQYFNTPLLRQTSNSKLGSLSVAQENPMKMI